jgi:hypothetical protein
MCWNSDISLNTFIFACFALLFIYLAGFTKYKIDAFNNPIVYLLLFEVALIQLIEYFLWKNLKNKNNIMLSKLAACIIFLQVPTIILMIPNLQIRYFLLLMYLLYLIVLKLSKKFHNPFHTSVSKNGHLSWDWLISNNYLIYAYLFLYLISALFINNIEISIMVIASLFITLFFFFKEKTFTSIWCWSSNLFLLYFIVKILIILPFYEYNGLC